MSWGEALRLLKILRGDTTSQFAAAMEGWEFTASREALAILDLYDRFVEANSDSKGGRPTPHRGRPFMVDNRDRRQIGDTTGRTREETIAILREHGHQIPA